MSLHCFIVTCLIFWGCYDLESPLLMVVVSVTKEAFGSNLSSHTFLGHRLHVIPQSSLLLSGSRVLFQNEENRKDSWDNIFQKMKIMKWNLPCPSIVFLRIKVAPSPFPDLWMQIPRNWLVFPLAYGSAVVTRRMLPTNSKEKWTFTWDAESNNSIST